MSEVLRSAVRSEDADQVLADLIAEITDQLHAGQRVDVEAYIARCPERAEQLHRLLPALELLDGLKSQSPHEGAIGPESEAPADGMVAGVLGDFRILREVGKGGMGVVYEAEQVSLRRRVALKVLPFAATMDPRHLRRFQNEAQAAAGLHHTNIVPVYFVGCERGVHFYAMQFIDGQPLNELIQQLRRAEKTAPAAGEEQTVAYQVSPEEAITTTPTVRAAGDATPLTGEGKRGRDYFRRVAELGVQAAEALDHAHQVGVVHRDIKPANLLLDGRGHVWVTDFGLAHCQSQASLTATGDLVGTLRYMSPEQALAQRVVIDHRTDVYSLGATLYELLTLRPAFGGDDRQELLRQIAFEEPARPRRLDRAIPAELETIILKAIEKWPQERYASAQELADDLRHWLNDMPIRAQRPTLLQHAAKWMRRHRTLARTAVGFLVLAVFLLSTSTWMIWRANQETKAALARADAKSRWARQAVNDMYTEVAEKWLARQPRLQPLQRAFLERALRYYQEASETDDNSPEAGWELALAYLRVGKIQGGLGDYAKAEQALRRAVEILEKWTREDPEGRINLAVAWGRLSAVLFVLDRHLEAGEAARKAITLYEQAADRPNSPADRSDLAVCYVNLGQSLEGTGALRAAEEAHRKALRIWEELCAREPDEPQHWADLALTLRNLGRVLLAT